MTPAVLSQDDPQRLAMVRQLGAQDAGSDAALRKLVTLAAEALGVNTVMVNLIDARVLQPLAIHGPALQSTDCSRNGCGHALASGRLVLAHDLRLDDRFASLDEVSARVPSLRFYAGVPLSVQGHAVGTLAALDTRPRPDFDAQHIARLEHLAELAQELLQQRLERQQARIEHALHAEGPVVAVVWEGQQLSRPVYLSANLAHLLGDALADELRAGRPFDSIVHPDDQHLLRTGLSSHHMGDLPSLDLSYRLRPVGRHERWVHQVSQADRDEAGRVTRIRAYLFDLTRQKHLEASIESTKERLHLALESARIGTWDLNVVTQERLLNARAAAMLGLRDDELEHSQLVWMDKVHPHDRMAIERAGQAYRSRINEVVSVEYRIRHKQGHYIWLRSHGRLVERDRKGEPCRVVGTLVDITEDKQREGLRNRQRQLLDLLNQAQTSFLLNRSVEEACEALFEPLLRISECSFGCIGIVQQDAQGQPVLSLPMVSDADGAHALGHGGLLHRLDNLFGLVVRDNQTVMCQHPRPHPSGLDLPAGLPELRNFLGLPIRFDHKVVGLLGLGNRVDGFDDQTVQLLEPLIVTLGTLFHARNQEAARVSAEAELLRLATRDALTGLANRRQFFDVAEGALTQTRRYGTPLTIALLDLDHFKHINDTHGHAAGDTVLKAFASVLRECLRDTDTPARVGGEEFAVLLSNTPLHEALHALERVRATLDQRPIEFGPHAIYATVSIGAVQWRPEHQDVDALLAHADEALYSAKRLGRNRVEVHRHDPASHEGEPGEATPHGEPPQHLPVRAANDH